MITRDAEDNYQYYYEMEGTEVHYDFEYDKLKFHNISGERLEEIIEEMREVYTHDFHEDEKRKDAFCSPNYDEEYGVDNGMFI